MHTVGLRCRCSPPSGPTLHMHRCPPAATVLRSRGKIRFMKRTHADKTLGSCESRLHEPELDSNDDLTGANVSRARTLASAARQKATRGKLKMQTDGYSRHVLRSKPRKMPRNWRRKRQCATVRAAISHARTHARARVQNARHRMLHAKPLSETGATLAYCDCDGENLTHIWNRHRCNPSHTRARATCARIHTHAHPYTHTHTHRHTHASAHLRACALLTHRHRMNPRPPTRHAHGIRNKVRIQSMALGETEVHAHAYSSMYPCHRY